MPNLHTLKRQPAWGVWFVTYGTYADVARDGDIPPRRVAGPMSLAEAMRDVAGRFSDAYCVKPW